LTTFYFDAASAGTSAAVHNFFQVFMHGMPAGITIKVPNSGDLIEETTGALSGTWSEAGGGGATLTDGAGEFAQGVGIQVRWRTDGVVGRRRVVGSTFICPILHSGFDASGTPTVSQVLGTNTAASGLLAAAPSLRIWSRPKGTRPGSSHVVTVQDVPRRVSWLRSRRT